MMATYFVLKAFAGMRVTDKVLREDGGNTVIEHPHPAGRVPAITPWNFPVVLLANKLGPCLLTGNTMVAKPAPTTPLTTLLLGEVIARILPPGVVNVIADVNDLGAALSTHPDVAKVAFTGSTATARRSWPRPPAA
jgi:acyl-CoA reductase-like NAD-dependent aldehyde dehydrogenase